MRWLRHLVWSASCVFFAAQFSTGCSDSGSSSGGEGRDQAGLDMCCELGSLCHEEGPASSPEEGDCHEMAHENDPSWCRANYERCVDICTPSGEGGQGGAPEEHFCVSAE